MPTTFSRMNYSLVACLLLFCSVSPTTAAPLILSFSQQHFTDGAKVSSGAFLAAHQADPATVNDTAPFNGSFAGSDIGGPNFHASWTYTFTPPAIPIASADLRFGILDADSAAPGSQLSAFTINGVSLFTELNSLLEASPGGNSNNGQNSVLNVYDIAFPASALTSISTGGVTVDLALQALGLGILGPTAFNGAALDFATLTMNAGTVIVTPEPSYLPALLLLAAVGSIPLFQRRLRQIMARFSRLPHP